ncbi:MAG: serine/threonine protein kinase [Acidimicrobiia bacterium]|nr:serine/threonine protein kinase [Acidimicrobiia bacterium]
MTDADARHDGDRLVDRRLAGRYRMVRPIASGGMAEVWEAHDETLGRAVAVKLLHPQFAADPTLRTRFHNEAVAAARLSDPRIVAILDTADLDGREAIVMELVRGRTLREWLDERTALEPVEVVHIGAEVASALAAAHRAGVIHRDIKPANILLSDDGRVMVTDFGIAKVLDAPDLTRTAQVLGTVKYLAPEQVEGGPVDGRTDIYALGAVLYEMLCGEPPFRAETPAALALARMHRDPTRPSAILPRVPVDLDETIMRALARTPAQRWSTAVDLRAALLATRPDVLAEDRRNDDDPVAVAHPRPRRRRSGMALAVIIVAVLIVLGLLLAGTPFGHRLLSSAAPTARTPAPIDRPEQPTPPSVRPAPG